MKEEIWKDIPGYDGQYKVSNFGRIQSFRSKYRGGQYYGMILKSHISKSKYVYQQLRKNNKTITHLLHRLVAEAFIPNPYNKPNINHLDNNPSNNCTTNLQWCTQKENIQYAANLGRMKNNTTWEKGTKPWNTGKFLSNEHKLKLSIIKRGKPSPKRKKVINMKTGIIYESATEAAKKNNINYNTFAGNVRENKGDFKYYKNENFTEQHK